MRYMNPPKKQSNVFFRVYYREVRPEGFRKEKWKLLATFLWKMDAKVFMSDRQEDLTTADSTEYKVMHGNRNVKVI